MTTNRFREALSAAATSTGGAYRQVLELDGAQNNLPFRLRRTTRVPLVVIHVGRQGRRRDRKRWERDGFDPPNSENKSTHIPPPTPKTAETVCVVQSAESAKAHLSTTSSRRSSGRSA